MFPQPERSKITALFGKQARKNIIINSCFKVQKMHKISIFHKLKIIFDRFSSKVSDGPLCLVDTQRGTLIPSLNDHRLSCWEWETNPI